MSTSKVSKLGEKSLDTWASQADIDINKSIEDATGWDFVLEFPLDTEPSVESRLPLDKLPPALQCWVQVRSSNGTPGKWDVKLSNWKRLIDTPLPAFFLVCEFDNQDDCQRAYLVHIGENCIRRVLKRLREAGLEKDPKLHKMWLHFKYEEADRLSSLSGRGLVEAIQRHVPGDLDGYFAWKKDLRESAGYEEGKFLAQAAILLPKEYASDPLKHLVNFSLGLVPRIETKRVEFKDVRFGIEAPELTRISEGGFVTLKDRKPFDTVSVRISSDDDEREVRLEMEMFVPQGFRHPLGEEYFKALYEAPFIAIVSQYKPVAQAEISIHLPDPDETQALQDLRPSSELILLIHYALTNNCDLSFQVKRGPDSFGSGFMLLDSRKDQLDELIVKVARLMHQAWIVSKYFDIQHKVELSTHALLNLSQFLNLLSGLLNKEPPAFKIQFHATVEFNHSFKVKCIPIVISLELGQFRILTSFVVMGNLRKVDSLIDASMPIEVVTNDVRLHRTRLIDPDQEPLEIMQSMFNALKSEYQEYTEILIIEGINSHLSGGSR